MGVRFATSADLDRVVSLAEQEHARSAWSHLPFDPVTCRATADQFRVMMGRTLLVTDGGYLAGLVQPAGFARGLLALEYAWYAQDGSGLSLLLAFEEWAKAMGAASVVVNSAGQEARLGRALTRRRGYRQTGAAYARNLQEAH